MRQNSITNNLNDTLTFTNFQECILEPIYIGSIQTLYYIIRLSLRMWSIKIKYRHAKTSIRLEKVQRKPSGLSAYKNEVMCEYSELTSYRLRKVKKYIFPISTSHIYIISHNYIRSTFQSVSTILAFCYHRVEWWAFRYHVRTHFGKRIFFLLWYFIFSQKKTIKVYSNTQIYNPHRRIF